MIPTSGGCASAIILFSSGESLARSYPVSRSASAGAAARSQTTEPGQPNRAAHPAALVPTCVEQENAFRQKKRKLFHEPGRARKRWTCEQSLLLHLDPRRDQGTEGSRVRTVCRLEVGDTADLEICATSCWFLEAVEGKKYRQRVRHSRWRIPTNPTKP